MYLKNKMLNFKSHIGKVRFFYSKHNIVICLLMAVSASMSGIFSYHENSNFWVILYDVLTNQTHNFLLFCLIVYNVVYISLKFKNHFFISRFGNYEKFLVKSFKHNFSYILFYICFDLLLNVIFAIALSNFNFEIIKYEFYQISFPLYILICILKEFIFAYLISFASHYIYNKFLNKKIILPILLAIPTCNFFVSQSEIIDGVFKLPLLYSYYLSNTLFSNIFMELSGVIIQIILLTLIIECLKGKKIKGDL